MSERFKWTRHSYAAKVPAATFGRWLRSLPNRNPATIVKAARPKSSPAHRLFTWTDTVAAAEFRLLEARLILGSFVIETTVVSRGKPDRVVVAPFISRSAPGEYEVTTEALRDDDKRRFMLSEALADLRRMKRRYSALSELSLVFAAVDALESRHARRARKRA